jgi:hypothetical protein
LGLIFSFLAAWFALLKQDFLAGLVSEKDKKRKDDTSKKMSSFNSVLPPCFCLLGGNCTGRDPGVKEEGFINGFG